MPLLLTRSDLRPLASNDDQLDAAIAAVRASIVTSHVGPAGETVFAGLALGNGDELATNFTSRGDDASLRIFPSQFQGERPNAWLGIQIGGESGQIESFIALDDLNALRTSVPAAVGACHLAPGGAATLAILGSGTQARSHARTLRRVLPELRAIRVWSPTRSNSEKFAAELTAETGLDVSSCATAEEAAGQGDVIAAVGRTPHGAPALSDPTCVRPGALFISVTGSGFNLLGPGARLALPTAHRPELIAHGFSSGLLRQKPPPPPPNALDLAEVIQGTTPARTSEAQTLVFELAGPYLWDIAILGWIRGWAEAHGVGSTVSLSG